MENEDLELQNNNYDTALCLAAKAGNVKIAKVMVNKNKGLLIIPGSQRMMPLYIAALSKKHDMVKYLYDNSFKIDGDFWTPQSRNQVLLKCVEADLFDVALQVVTDHPELAVNGSVLRVLARKPDAFKGNTTKKFFSFDMVVRLTAMDNEALQLLGIMWKAIVRLPKDDVDNILRGPPDLVEEDEEAINMEVAKRKYSSHILFVAAEIGNTIFLTELIREYPDIIWKVNYDKHSIFHVAVSHRHERIYKLLYEIGSIKDSLTTLEDKYGNNMLHLVGEIPMNNRLQDVPGVVLQLQRELLWFKEVEAILPYSYREKKNTAGLTPHELFTKNHKDQVSQGEKWMKEVATQLMVVAALIATIAFAAAFTLPGGYNQATGFPIFIKNKHFTSFILYDAFSFICATMSIFMVLSILTSRYAEDDFLVVLPLKLMACLVIIVFSLMTMIFAFAGNFYVLYQNNSKWMSNFIGFLGLTSFLFMVKIQYFLLVIVGRTIIGLSLYVKPM